MATSSDEPRRPSVPLRWLRELLLTAGAFIGLLCFTAAGAGVAFGVTPLVFGSGSMAPAIETGALALARSVPADQLRVGDVVSVPTASKIRVTHRVQSVAVEEGWAHLVLKGDANEVPDAESYVVASADRVVWDIPKVGYAVTAAGSPAGRLLGGLVVAALLWLAFPRTSTRAVKAPTRSRLPWVTFLVILVASTGAVPSPARPVATLAAWTDTSTIASEAITADTLRAPSVVACATYGDGVRLSWTSADTVAPTRYGHRVTLTASGRSADLAPLPAGTNDRVIMPNDVAGAGGGLLGGILGSTTTVEVGLRAIAGENWVSSPTAAPDIVYRDPLLGTTTVRCS